MAQVKFSKGESSRLQNADKNSDTFYLTTDKQTLNVYNGNKIVPVNANVIRGDGTNSIVANDLDNNTAISENTCSFGTNNKGGLKGYYWSAINIASKTITLATAHTGGTAVTCGYAVGDFISIVNGSRFDECSKITAISGSVITVDALPFSSVSTASGDWTDYCIYCPEKTDIGLADLGRDCFIAGNGNKGGNWCSVVAGRDNNVIGQYGVAMGRQNKVAYAGFAVGRDNKVLGQYASSAGGSKNNVSGDWSIAGGYNNTAKGPYSTASGQSNTVNGRCSTVSGSSNRIEGEYSFSSGYHNVVEGDYSTGFGNTNNIQGDYSIANGDHNDIQGSYSSGFGKTNTIIGENSFSAGISNTAYTKASSTLGDSNISGIRGYNIRSISGSVLTLFSTCDYSVGDTVSIGIGQKYNNNLKITAINGNKITLSESISIASDQQFLYCESKPNIGSDYLGGYSSAIGYGNKSFGIHSHCIGRENVSPSSYGVATGFRNRVGYCGFAAGYNNKTDKEFTVMLGVDNNANANSSYLVGKGLKSVTSHQFITGKFNETVADGIRITGYGTSDNVRENLEVLDTSGNLKIAGSLTLDMNKTATNLTAKNISQWNSTAATVESSASTWNLINYPVTISFSDYENELIYKFWFTAEISSSTLDPDVLYTYLLSREIPGVYEVKKRGIIEGDGISFAPCLISVDEISDYSSGVTTRCLRYYCSDGTKNGNFWKYIEWDKLQIK